MNKEDEIKYYIDEIKFEIENIKKYIRYEQRISIGDEFYNAMQEILKMHDEIYNLNFLNDLLKECACDFYEEYTKLILFVSQKYTDFNNYDFTLTDSKTNEEKRISAKEAMKYAKLQQIRKDAKNVKEKYNISGDSKDKAAYVEFDIVTVGGKQYLGKYEEW